MIYAAAALAFSATAIAASSHSRDASAQYDYVVVGGGTSGLVVANRLSEDPSVTVAIIEAGGSVFNNTNVTDINGYGKAFGTDIDWAYESEAQIFAGNKPQTLRAAKALGGTSTINGMTYMRAESSQIDSWAKIGNNITWNSLLPYYKKSETFQRPNPAQIQDGASYEAEFHGFDGPLKVGWPAAMVGDNFSSVLNATFDALDLPWNGEPNAGSMRGFDISPKTLNTMLNVREDAARAYHFPVSNRSNLHVYLDSFAEQVTWETATRDSEAVANGVVMRDALGNQRHISATKEVILSAGALRSPLILELSGVGNPAILTKYGIEVKVNLPTVGENLQDQTTVDISYTATQNFTGSGGFIGYFNAKDVFGSNLSNISAQIKLALPSYVKASAAASGNTVSESTLQKLFNIQHTLIFHDLAVISEVIVNAPSASSGSLEYWGLTPFSRGGIHIISSNASAPASINPNYFQHSWDILQQIATAKAARSTALTLPLSSLLPTETLPGLDIVPINASDATWEKWLKSVYRSNFHYISTAAMMARDLGGVVDSDHRVYGTKNVRVVDASVLPFQVSGHLTSTLYALAERAADRIKAVEVRG